MSLEAFVLRCQWQTETAIGESGDEAVIEICGDHFRKYSVTVRDTHLDHDQLEKGVHRVGADVHSIRYHFAG
jgi:hypothetical protein